MSRLPIIVFASAWLVASLSSAQQVRLKQAAPAPAANAQPSAQKAQPVSRPAQKKKALPRGTAPVSSSKAKTGQARGTPAGGSGQPGQASQTGKASGAGKMAAAASKASASASQKKGGMELLYPKGGEELISGTVLEIKWKKPAGNDPVGVVLMMEHKYNRALKFPVVLSKGAAAAGPFRYKLPLGFNSRDGWHYKVMVQQGQNKAESGYFTSYPEVDLRPVNIKIRNKKKHWGLKALKTIALGGMGNIPGMTEASAIRETVRYAKKDGKAISCKSPIVIEYDLENRGTQIRSGLMSKVTIRLTPGNAELNSAGFKHDRVIPGRKYHQKGTIKAKDWELAPGRYILEIEVDPQNNANEPEELRANNVKTVEFVVK